MKISTRQLRKIISEELRLFVEQDIPSGDIPLGSSDGSVGYTDQGGGVNIGAATSQTQGDESLFPSYDQDVKEHIREQIEKEIKLLEIAKIEVPSHGGQELSSHTALLYLQHLKEAWGMKSNTEWHSQIEEEESINEGMMVDLKPINLPQQDESMESKWMRIAGIVTESDVDAEFAAMDAEFADMKSRNPLDRHRAKEATGNTHYPASKNDIPDTVKKMNDEINGLGPRPESLRARSDWVQNRMDIYTKYGLVRQDDNAYTFRLKTGSEAQVDK